MSHVFISYARQEAFIAIRVEKALREHGVQTWRTVSATAPSRSFHGEMRARMPKLSHFVFCQSNKSDLRSEGMEQIEIGYALVEDRKRQLIDPQHRLPIIPLIFPGGQPPPMVAAWTPIHIHDETADQAALEQLLERLQPAEPNKEETWGENIPQHLEEFLDALQHENLWKRKKGAEDLGWEEDPAAIAALTCALYDVNGYARSPEEAVLVPQAAAQALARIGPAAIPCLLVALHNEAKGFASFALRQIGSPAIAGLRDALREGNNTARAGAASALGGIGDPLVLDDLLTAVGDPEALVQESAIGALRTIGDPRAIPVLIKALFNEDRTNRVRCTSAWALGDLQDVRAVQPLIATLQNQNQDIKLRVRSARSLGKIGDQRAVGELILTLTDENKTLHGSSASALGAIGDPAAVPALIHTLRDQHPYAAWVAAQSLGQIGDPDAVPALLEALNTGASLVRAVTAKALGIIGDRTALPGLRKALRDRDRMVRKYAAQALGMLGDPAAIPGLRRALWDRNKAVRRAAREALDRIRPEE